MFQDIVDQYGVPTYQEANPALFTIVTFPFFFGMMFGDMGHGSIYMILGLILVMFKNCLRGTALEGLESMRYFILLCGFMATYCGLVYNEFFALPTQIFGSCYDLENREMLYEKYMYKRTSFDCNVAFGTDPVWGVSRNKLTFVNNIKMKMSVIFGIAHMTMGILVKGTNCIYNGHWLEFFTEVIAGLAILLGLFGWMDALIIAKWFHSIDIFDPVNGHIEN